MTTLYQKQENLDTRTITNINEIIKYLHFGTSIPLWSEFYEYILSDFEYFDVFAYVLLEHNNPVGNVLIYNDRKGILYFGYFGVVNHKRERILYLIKKIVEYARNNGYKTIRGPINIPTIIYGWGFLKEGSNDDLFIGKPVNPPIYQKLFLENGFVVKFEEKTWEGNLFKIDPLKNKKYKFEDYEFIIPKDFNDFLNYRQIFLDLHAKNLPVSAQVTPSIAGVFDNYVRFVFKYGEPYMFFFVRDKQTNKIIACGNGLPNPFRKDAAGNYDSFVAYSWVVEKEYRTRGIGYLMAGAYIYEGWKRNIRYANGPIEASNIQNTNLAIKLGFENKRSHLILEYEF